MLGVYTDVLFAERRGLSSCLGTSKHFKHLKKHITLLTYYLLTCLAMRVPTTSSQS